jgi:hypothetical protein
MILRLAATWPGANREGQNKYIYLYECLYSLVLNCRDLIGPKIAIADDKTDLSKYIFFFP